MPLWCLPFSQRFDLNLNNQMFIMLFPYMWNPFKNILMTFETFLMMSITTERYLAIKNPLEYRLGKVRIYFVKKEVILNSPCLDQFDLICWLSVAVLLLYPLGHLHPASPPPLRHLQHPKGDDHHDGHDMEVLKIGRKCSKSFINQSKSLSSSLRLSWCGSKWRTAPIIRLEKLTNKHTNLANILIYYIIIYYMYVNI